MASGPFANHLGASDRQLARCAIVRARFNIGSRPRRLGLLRPRLRKSPLLVQREEHSATSLGSGHYAFPGSPRGAMPAEFSAACDYQLRAISRAQRLAPDRRPMLRERAVD